MLFLRQQRCKGPIALLSKWLKMCLPTDELQGKNGNRKEGNVFVLIFQKQKLSVLLLFSFPGSCAFYVPNDWRGFYQAEGDRSLTSMQLRPVNNAACQTPCWNYVVQTPCTRHWFSLNQMAWSASPTHGLGAWTAFTVHLGPTLEARSLSEATGCLVNRAPDHLWPEIGQKHKPRELLRNFSCSGGGWLAMWPSGKRTKDRSLLKTAEMSFFESYSSGAAWPQLACAADTSPSRGLALALARLQMSHRVLLPLPELSWGQKASG